MNESGLSVPYIPESLERHRCGFSFHRYEDQFLRCELVISVSALFVLTTQVQINILGGSVRWLNW